MTTNAGGGKASANKTPTLLQRVGTNGRYVQYWPSTSSVVSTLRVAAAVVGSSSENLGPGLKALLMVELASETRRPDAKRGFVSVLS